MKNNHNNLKQVQQKNLKSLRKKQWEKQGKKCPILNKKIPFEKSVFDHKHITKKEIKEGKIGEDGKGLLRGVLHNQINVFLGKIENSWKRTGCHKLGADLSEVLINCSKFIKTPPIEKKYIHPKEVMPPEYLMKRDFNRIKKYYFVMFPNRRKLPIWKEKIKMNDKWEELIKKTNGIYEQEKK